MKPVIPVLSLMVSFVLLPWIQAPAQHAEWDPELTELWEPVPGSIVPGAEGLPPADAIILFDGSGVGSWEGGSKWSLDNGVLVAEPGTGGIRTRQGFGDIQLHLEWRIPDDVDGESQERGNSGIFLQERYEIQILDSYENETYVNGQAGAVYKQYPPLVNASFPPGRWQTYDIIFEAPVFRQNGKLVKPAYMSVLHNGILIHHRVRLHGPTIFRGLPGYEAHAEELPIAIQGSRHKLGFRNIWVRKL
ncbi:MAG: DUF1080 domain-containing protein [Balneolales bacterium]